MHVGCFGALQIEVIDDHKSNSFVSVTFVGINDEIAPCKGDLERKTLASFVLAITCYWRGRRSITQHKHNVREKEEFDQL